MPRIARIKAENLTYHIISRGNNKMTVFHNAEDYDNYLKILKKYKQKFDFCLYHFALMPNHIHLLLKSGSDISKLMHSINLSYVHYYKKRYEYIGHFWQDRFKSLVVQDDNYLLTVGAYIELNPLRSGLVNRLEEYKYSSYNLYAHGIDCGIDINFDPWYLSLAENPTPRKQIYQKFMASNIAALRIVKSQFIGSEDFAKHLIKERFRKRIKLKRGRPQKNTQ